MEMENNSLGKVLCGNMSNMAGRKHNTNTQHSNSHQKGLSTAIGEGLRISGVSASSTVSEGDVTV